MNTLAPHAGASFTVEDLEALERGSHRYELYDGALVVTPAPNARHQIAVGELYAALRAVATPDLQVLFAPYDWAVSNTTVFEPDLIVASKRDLARNPDRLEQSPVLAVEVLSPSTRALDLGAKRVAFAAAGLPHYWIVDAAVPYITALELDVDRGDYVEVGTAAGDELLVVERPFAMTISPSSLVIS
jgi:Uma2 family endonuclease